MVRRALAFVSIVASLTRSSPCLAQVADGPASAPTDPAPKVDALPVAVKLVSTAIQAEAIRTAIETELRVPVRVEDTLPDEGLSVTVKWRRATVSYRSKQNETTTRSLHLPANSEQAVEVIALLAGNLARDEASELLARLSPPPAEPPAEAESPAPAVETPPAPKPAEPVKKEDAKPAPAEKEPATKPELDGLIRGNPGSLNLTLWYPATLLDHTERRALNGELGFAYSRVGAVEGLGFTVGHLRVEKDVRGVAGSFGWTRVDGDIVGVQLGGLVNEAYGKVRGADVSEIASVRAGDVEGAQASGFFNRARNVTGAQMSAGFSLGQDIVGLQSGFVAVARDVDGAQINFLGMARDIQGAQLGLLNVARDVDGGQLGLVNVARDIDVQLGLVNVADRVNGAAIGLVSIAGNGAVQPTAYVIGGGGRDSLNAGVRFVAGYAYSLLAVGATEEGSKPRTRAEAGGGFHLPISFPGGAAVDRGALELGVHFGHTWFQQGDGSSEEDFLHYRGGFGLRVLRFVWLLGGYDVSHDLSPFGERVGYGPWFGLAVF